MSDGTSEDVLAAADQNMLSAWRGVIAGSPAPGAVEDGDVVMLSSGVPVSLFNPAFVTGRPQAPAAMVTRVVDHYAELGLPFVLYFRDEITPELVDPCAAAGLVEHFRPPLMATVPEGRGKGVGAALTWAAALAGGAAGATRSMLQSSEQGEPVYRRMGYTTPTRYRQFEPPSA